MNYTLEHAQEYVTSAANPEYFIENFISTEQGLFVLSDQQKDWIRRAEDSRIVILGTDRASGRSNFMLAYAIWLAIFRPYTTVLLIYPSSIIRNMTRQRMQMLFTSIPEWMRPKTVHNNTTHVSFDNRSQFIFDVASHNTGRGMTLSLVLMDDCNEKLSPQKWEELIGSVYPNVSYGCKIITTGT